MAHGAWYIDIRRLVLSLGLAMAGGAALAQPTPTAELDRLRTLSAHQGSVRVIIGVGDASMAPTATSSILNAQRRTHMRAAQGKVVDELLSGHGAKVHALFNTVPHVAAEVDTNTLEQLRASPLVYSIQEDVAVPPTLLQSTAMIHANTAWAGARTGTGWAVAVLDTGVDRTHPFLSGRIVSEACYSSNTAQSTSVCPGGVTSSVATGSGVSCNTSISGCTHGTHVAGIVAGAGAPDGSSGVAPSASVIAIQVFSHFPASGAVMSYTSDQIKGLERVYALRDTYKIAAVNMSLGGGQYTSTCDSTQPAIKSAIDNLRSVGIATIIASGNNGYLSSISAPACVSSAISVGSHCDAGPDGSACGTGVGGVASYSNIASFVSLLAPGSYINSSIPGGSYTVMQGTSMAAPHVAGAWALLKHAQPNISVTDGLSQFKSYGVAVNDTRPGASVSGLTRIDLAFLAANAHALTVSKAGTGTGSVNSAPTGIQCGSDCTESYEEGTAVTLNASPSTGSVLAGWSGACSGTGACTVSMTEARSVTATFNLSPYTLTLVKAGTGTGTVTSNPSGINCGSTCSTAIARNTTVTLTATPATGSRFTGWSGACTGTTTTCTVSMTAARSVTATFAIQSYSVRVSKSGTGSGAVVSSPTGINCGTTCSATRAYGSAMTLTATPVSGSVFAGWSGACTGTGSCTVTVTNTTDVMATFSRTHNVLTASRTGTGVGTITTDTGGINCGSTCSATLAASTTVTLTATPASGSLFAGWSSACTGTATTCSVDMSTARSVKATFTRITYALSVTRSGTGTGAISSSPAGINCGTTCSASYASGTTVTLTARPESGNSFSGWSGACSGTGTCVVTMSEAQNVAASFTRTHQRLVATRAGTGTGTVVSSPAALNCGTACSVLIPVGTSTTLTARAAPESTFVGWGGACSGSDATCTVSMANAQAVSTTFTRTHFTLSIARTGFGSVSIANPAVQCLTASCKTSIPINTTVTLTATPATGSRFVGWSGACTGTGSCTVTLSAARSVTAAFALMSYPMTVSKDGTGSGTVTSSPSGLSCGSTCTVSRVYGSTMTLTATPASGSVFAGWTGACSGTGTCTLPATGAQSVGATFTLTHVPLSVKRLGTGTGRVSALSPTLSCTSNCSTLVPLNATVTLEAVAAPESVFTGWSGACTGTDPCSVSMSAMQTVSATFTRSHYTLSVARSGTGQGQVTSTNPSIACDTACKTSIAIGTSVTLTPVPAEGSRFVGWSGACTGTWTCTVTMSAARSVTANFARITYTLTSSKSGTGSGTISSTPSGISCGTTCSKVFSSGTSVTLTAIPALGSTFGGWSGACSGTGTCTLSITATQSVAATFTRP